MLHSGLLMCPYLYFLWHYQTSTVKTQHLAKYNDLAKKLVLIDSLVISVNWQHFWRNLHVQPHMKISSHSVYGVFKDLSNISARSDSIQIHPDSLSGAVTHSQTQTGDREATASPVCFCAKKRGWKRQTTQKNIFCSLKSPTTLDKKPLFSYMRLDCTIWNHGRQFHS